MGEHRFSVLVLIPMGDWCGSVPQPDDEKPGASISFAAMEWRVDV
jgi:hypothetical protein